MSGRAQLACDVDERWNGPPPKCEGINLFRIIFNVNNHYRLYYLAIQCEPPAEIINGLFNITETEIVFGTTIQYTCNSGFKLFGPSQITCTSNGQYDHLPPHCQGMLHCHYMF